MVQCKTFCGIQDLLQNQIDGGIRLQNNSFSFGNLIQNLHIKLFKRIDDAASSCNGESGGERTSMLRDVYLNPTARMPPKLIRGKSGSPHAFCLLVMNRDAYALGAAVLAHRLRKLNSKADVV